MTMQFNMKNMWILGLFLLISLPCSLEAAWETLQKGVDHQVISYQNGHIHLYRLHLKKIQLDLLDARQYGMNAMSVRDFAVKSNALLVINGGFFQEGFAPLGLMIQKGKQLNPLRRVEWGVFYIEKDLPKITHARKFEINPDITTALQSGPRLVIAGTIPSLVPGTRSQRSAIGMTANNEVILAITQNVLLTLSEWAQIISQHCTYALNLDGGGSSQLFQQLRGQELFIAGITPVPNAFAVFDRY